MPHFEGDISWQLLRQIVHDWAGTAAELADVTPLYGGCINQTLKLQTTDGAAAVLKLSQHRVDRSYDQEAHQLDLLRSLGVPTPRVYSCKIGSLEDPHSYLLMEFVDGVDLNAAKQCCSAAELDDVQRHLAEIVLTLHRNTAEEYHRVAADNGVAGAPPNPTFTSWPAFYRAVYDPIWHEIEKMSALPVKSRKQIAKVHEKLDRLIAHTDKPRLVHWDIWATNLLVKQDDAGRWRVSALLDPNCKYAHSEAEIAYLDLFHTITPAFKEAYQREFKLDDAYHRFRKPVYQLYPLLNHLKLFGQEYLKPLMQQVERVSALV